MYSSIYQYLAGTDDQDPKRSGAEKVLFPEPHCTGGFTALVKE
jgi:hypothetical protein